MTGDAVENILVRAAEPGELAEVAELLGRAFPVDPVYVWLYPDPEQRRRRLRILMRAFVLHLHRGAGPVDVAVRGGQLVGAALWDRPGQVAAGPWRTARALPGMLRATGSRMPALAELGTTLEAARPAHPHWYLFHLAADPDAQGSGIGSALLDVGLARADAGPTPARAASPPARGAAAPARADAAPAPAYLECKPELVGYYGRWGFARRDTVEVDGGALAVEAMERPAADA